MMRKLFSAAIAALCLGEGSVQASLIADSFVTGSGGYSTGNINNQNPSRPGFTSSWSLGTGSTIFHVDSTSISTTGSAGYTTGGSVGATGATADAAQSIARAVSLPASNVYYMSGTYERGNSTSITAGSYALMGWGNSVLPSAATSNSTLQGVYVGYTQTAATSSGGTLDDYGSLIIRSRQRVPQSAGSSTYVERNVDTILQDGQAISTYLVKFLVVTKLTLNGSSAQLDYWVNPTSLTSDAQMNSTSTLYGTVTIDSVGSGSDLSQLTFAESGYDSLFSFDEPRIATTLSDLSLQSSASTPEPGMLGLLTLTSTALLCNGRRRA